MEIHNGWAGAIFCMISVLFALLLRTRNPVLLWLRTALPLLLVGIMFAFGESSDLNTKLSVAITGLSVSRADSGASRRNDMTIGNSTDQNDLVVRPVAAEGYLKASPDVPQTYLAVSGADSPDGHPGHPVLTTYPGSPATGQPAMIVAYGLHDQARTFVGAIALDDGDTVCFDETCSDKWTFDATFRDRLMATAADQDRRSGLPTPAFNLPFLHGPLKYSQRVYRLAEPERHGRQTAFFVGDDGHWNVLPLEDRAYVRRSQGEKVTANLKLSCTIGEHAPDPAMPACSEVSIYRLDLPDNQLNNSVKLAKRRSVALSATDTAIVMKPLPSDTETAGTCKTPSVQLTRISLLRGQTQTYLVPDDVLRFADLGDTVLNQVGDGPLPSADIARACEPGLDKFVHAEGTNTPIVLSQGKNGTALHLSVINTAIPWSLLGLGAVISLLVGFCSVRYWTTHRVDSAICGLIHYLVMLRLLIGVRGIFLDPALSTVEVFGDVGAAIIGLPVIAMALRPATVFGTKARAVSGGIAAIGFALLYGWLVKPDKVYWSVAIATVIALAWPYIAGARPLQGLVSRAGAALTGGWRSLVEYLARLGPHIPWAAVVLIVGAVVLRGLAVLAGIKERSGIALSTPYLLLILPGFALYLADFAKKDEKVDLVSLALFYVLLLLAFLVMAMWTRDHGFAFVHIIPVLGVTAWLAWRGGSLPGRFGAMHRWGRIALVPVAVAVALVILIWPAHVPPPVPPHDSLADFLAYARAFNSSNDLRLLHQFFPQRVAMVGTRLAAENLQFWVDVRSFTSGPNSLFGGQYLIDTNLGEFKRQALHLSDNLSAVHIMAPFGRMGAMALLLVLFAGAWVVTASVSREDHSPWQTIAGQLMIWTVFTVAAYMVLANLGLVPFTGRNIYLLAAKSGSDLLEGMMLLLLARYWLERRPVA